MSQVDVVYSESISYVDVCVDVVMMLGGGGRGWRWVTVLRPGQLVLILAVWRVGGEWWVVARLSWAWEVLLSSVLSCSSPAAAPRAGRRTRRGRRAVEDSPRVQPPLTTSLTTSLTVQYLPFRASQPTFSPTLWAPRISTITR